MLKIWGYNNGMTVFGYLEISIINKFYKKKSSLDTLKVQGKYLKKVLFQSAYLEMTSSDKTLLEYNVGCCGQLSYLGSFFTGCGSLVGLTIGIIALSLICWTIFGRSGNVTPLFWF